jgi:hypothetical protein
MQHKLKIKIPKKKKRPEEELRYMIKDGNTGMPVYEFKKKLDEFEEKAPPWMADFIRCLTYGTCSPEDGFKKINSGTFKTVYAFQTRAVSIEKIQDKDRDKELYSLLRKIKGCPGVMFPIDTYYWLGFKFNIMNLCIAGDLRNIMYELTDPKSPITVPRVLRNLYELGFTLLQMHKTGIYPTDMKPENILFCRCVKTHFLTIADLDECILGTDFIGDELKAYQSKTLVEKGGFLTQSGRRTYPSTRGYNMTHYYRGFKLPISRMEAMFEGWYAYAHMYLEVYSYLMEKTTKNNKKRAEMYAGKYGWDFRRPARIDGFKFTADYIALKMYKIIRSGTNYKDYINYNGYRITKEGKIIDEKSWEKYFNDVIVKEYDMKNRKTWYENIGKEFEEFKKDYNIV